MVLPFSMLGCVYMIYVVDNICSDSTSMLKIGREGL